MTEQTNDQPQSTRLVNADMLSTQEMRAFGASSGGDTREMLRPEAPQRGESRSTYQPVERITLSALVLRGFVTIFTASTLFAIVALLVLMWIVPPWYQSLTPRLQSIWCYRVSALCELQEKAPADDILAIDNSAVDADAALALLDVPTEISSAETGEPIVTPTATLTAKGGNNLDQQSVTVVPSIQAPSATPSPTPMPVSLVASLDLNRLKWEEQGWNNCGPTTLTIGLTFFGYTHNQDNAVKYLKPNIEDKNVSPAEMVDFVNSQAISDTNVKALYRIGGSADLLKLLIDKGFPVIIERGIDVVGSGWMGHYSLVVGYSDTQSQYYLYDSYFGHGDGQGRPENQDVINAGWKEFNNSFVVIYEPSQESQLLQLLGRHADMPGAATVAVERARSEASANPDDKWAWFNMGSALTMLGKYNEAVLAFDRARTLDLPFRMLWYQFGPYEAYYQVKRYDDVLALALANEHQTPYVEEVYYYRGLVYAARGNVDDAVKQFDKAITYNRNFEQAKNVKQSILEGRFTPPA